MQYRTVTERIGEELGPIDWTHPMSIELAEKDPKLTDLLREAAATPDAFEATNDGGCPKFGWGPVAGVVMYDGWPFWQPTPHVCYLGWEGVRRQHIGGTLYLRRKAQP